MFKTSCLFVFMIVTFAATCALAQNYPDITGNSIAQMQGGFQTYYASPLQVPSSNITIFGFDSYTCQHLLPLISYAVPAKTTHVVLIDSTNDVNTGVSINDHMNCMYQTIDALITRNPSIRIFVANTPPQVQGCDSCPCADRRDIIDTYNAAYRGDPGSGFPGFQASYPHNVRVVDVWTPNALHNRYASPYDMTGSCGIHPGPGNQWSDSWSHFSKPYLDAIRNSYGKNW